MTDSPDVASAIAVRLLPAEGEKFREDLIKLLGKRKLDSATLVTAFESQDPELVRKVLPTVISRLIVEKKSQDQARAELIREAVLQLESKHNFNFRWNDLYKNFIRGLTTSSRVTENDINFVKRVFGNDYITLMNLPSTNSAVRQLRPLGSLMERLNLDVETVPDYLFRVRDERIQRRAGTQGLRRHVINDDIAHVKLELNRLMWTKRRRGEDDEGASGRSAKRTKTCRMSPELTVKCMLLTDFNAVSREIIDDEDDEDLEPEAIPALDDEVVQGRREEDRDDDGDGETMSEEEDAQPVPSDKHAERERGNGTSRISNMNPR